MLEQGGPERLDARADRTVMENCCQLHSSCRGALGYYSCFVSAVGSALLTRIVLPSTPFHLDSWSPL